jgi:hypothetical protein
MSIGISAYTRALPQDWRARFAAEMQALDIGLELHPDFPPADPDVDQLWARLDFHTFSRLRPGVSLLVGCGYALIGRAEIEARNRWRLYPPEAREMDHFWDLQSSAGRAEATGAVQVVVCAALATIADGVVHGLSDDDEVMRPGEALRAIVRSHLDLLSDRGAIPFTGWPPLDLDEAERFPFAAAI